jgi:hypothetical protein
MGDEWKRMDRNGPFQGIMKAFAWGGGMKKTSTRTERDLPER